MLSEAEIVKSTKFMMEFTNQCSASCEFPLNLSQIQQDWRPMLQFKIDFLAEAHNFSLATVAKRDGNDSQVGEPIMGVWSMKRKRNLLGHMSKHKARLCAHGGQTIEGVHCDATHT